MTETAKLEALKPCPFCGGDAHVSTYQTESLWSHDQVTYTKVSCDQCDIAFQTEPGHEAEAITAWNTRALSAPRPAVKGLEIEVVLGAQKIFELFCGRPVDWSAHSLEDADDTIFRSADWLQAMAYSRAILSSLSPPTCDVSIQGAAADVLNERRRQVEAEGWTPEHDDAHSNGEMIEAAACYSITAGSVILEPDGEFFRPPAWPWAPEWWKPSTPRRMLVKAAALLIAEIERLDRTALTKEQQE